MTDQSSVDDEIILVENELFVYEAVLKHVSLHTSSVKDHNYDGADGDTPSFDSVLLFSRDDLSMNHSVPYLLNDVYEVQLNSIGKVVMEKQHLEPQKLVTWFLNKFMTGNNKYAITLPELLVQEIFDKNNPSSNDYITRIWTFPAPTRMKDLFFSKLNENLKSNNRRTQSELQNTITTNSIIQSELNDEEDEIIFVSPPLGSIESLIIQEATQMKINVSYMNEVLMTERQQQQQQQNHQMKSTQTNSHNRQSKQSIRASAIENYLLLNEKLRGTLCIHKDTKQLYMLELILITTNAAASKIACRVIHRMNDMKMKESTFVTQYLNNSESEREVFGDEIIIMDARELLQTSISRNVALIFGAADEFKHFHTRLLDQWKSLSSLEALCNLSLENRPLLRKSLCVTHSNLVDYVKRVSNESLSVLGELTLSVMGHHYYYCSSLGENIDELSNSLMTNDHLTTCAIRIELSSFVISLDGNNQTLSDEQIVQSLKALVGAIFTSHGMTSVRKFCNKYIFPNVMPRKQKMLSNTTQKSSKQLRNLETLLNHKFSNSFIDPVLFHTAGNSIQIERQKLIKLGTVIMKLVIFTHLLSKQMNVSGIPSVLKSSLTRLITARDLARSSETLKHFNVAVKKNDLILLLTGVLYIDGGLHWSTDRTECDVSGNFIHRFYMNSIDTSINPEQLMTISNANNQAQPIPTNNQNNQGRMVKVSDVKQLILNNMAPLKQKYSTDTARLQELKKQLQVAQEEMEREAAQMRDLAKVEVDLVMFNESSVPKSLISAPISTIDHYVRSRKRNVKTQSEETNDTLESVIDDQMDEYIIELSSDEEANDETVDDDDNMVQTEESIVPPTKRRATQYVDSSEIRSQKRMKK